MIFIKRIDEPKFWNEFNQKNPSISYDDLQNTEEGRAVRNKLREYNINQQHGLCAYCCRLIDLENSLNEHIKPRGLGAYAKLSMDYSNIVASCKTEGNDSTCSSYKKNKYDSRFVSPLEKDCEKYFEFYENGEMVSDSPRGKYTIDVLNLNSYRLRKARRAQLKNCKYYNSLDMIKQVFLEPDKENRLQPFVDIIRFFYRRNTE